MLSRMSGTLLRRDMLPELCGIYNPPPRTETPGSEVQLAGGDLVLITEGVQPGVQFIAHTHVHLPLLVIRIPWIFRIELQEQVNLHRRDLEDGLPVDLGQVDAVGPVISASGANLRGPGSFDAPNDLHLLGKGQATVEQGVAERDQGPAVIRKTKSTWPLLPKTGGS